MRKHLFARAMRVVVPLVMLLAFASVSTVSAETYQGVKVTVFDNSQQWEESHWSPQIPPLGPEVGSFIQSSVFNNFDAFPVFNLYDIFIVKYEGYITSQTDGVFYFYVDADDGTRLFVNDKEIANDWYVKCCGGSVSSPVELKAGVPAPFTLWFFEYGGGARVDMLWLNNGIWERVPETSLTTKPINLYETTTTEQSTTTTESSTTTTIYEEPTTTTTVIETTTTTTTLVRETTTTIPEQMTTTTQLETPQTSSTVPEYIPVVPVETTLPKQEETPVETTTSTTSIPKVIDTLTTSTTVPADSIPNDISPQQGAEMASNPEILASISSDDAKDVFSAINEESLTDEQAAEIIAAVQDAPSEIREVFEDTVDLFSGTFDEYQMVGQTISVGERRTIVAVSLVTTTIAAAAAAGGIGNPGGGASPNSGNSPGRDPNQAARKRDEEDSEMAGEISGDGVDWVKSLSIYKTIDGEKVMDWKAFIKKFWFGVMNLGFTIAGSVVVYFTLSGQIQKIALISTLLAFAAAMYLHMRDED